MRPLVPPFPFALRWQVGRDTPFLSLEAPLLRTTFRCLASDRLSAALWPSASDLSSLTYQGDSRQGTALPPPTEASESPANSQSAPQPRRGPATTRGAPPRAAASSHRDMEVVSGQRYGGRREGLLQAGDAWTRDSERAPRRKTSEASLCGRRTLHAQRQTRGEKKK